MMTQKYFSFLCLTLIGFFLLALPSRQSFADPTPAVKVTKTVLSVQPSDSMAYAESSAVSPDATHLAYVATEKAGMRVMTDNKAGNLYDQIAKGFPIFSPKKNRVGYIATKDGASLVVVDGTEYPGFGGACCLCFSPNGEKFAYIAQQENKQVVMVNGKPQQPFDAIDRQIGLIFSPDSRRMAYTGLRQDRVVLVIDGKAQGTAYDIIEEVAFSPDSKHIAYIASAQKKYFAAQNDTLHGPFDMADTLTWSPDSSTLTFVAIKNDNWMTVRNGKETPSGKYVIQTVFHPEKKGYEYMVPQIVPPVFSPDSRRLAFTRADGFRYRVCVDEQEGPPFDSVGLPVFSPDSRHHAYIGIISQQEKGAKHTLVHDGRPVATYDAIVPPVVFSPDSKRIGVRAGRDRKGFIVIDGKEGPAYDNVSPPLFSPDSRRVVYKALKNGKTVVVTDGQEGEPFYETTPPFFSPKGSHVAYLAQEASLSCFLVINGKKAVAFSSFATDQSHHTPIIFDTENRLHFIGLFLEKNRFHGYRFDVDINPQSGGTP